MLHCGSNNNWYGYNPTYVGSFIRLTASWMGRRSGLDAVCSAASVKSEGVEYSRRWSSCNSLSIIHMLFKFEQNGKTIGNSKLTKDGRLVIWSTVGEDTQSIWSWVESEWKEMSEWGICEETVDLAIEVRGGGSCEIRININWIKQKKTIIFNQNIYILLYRFEKKVRYRTKWVLEIRGVQQKCLDFLFRNALSPARKSEIA